MNLTTKLLVALLIVLGVITYFLLPSGEEREASYKIPVISLKVDSAAVTKIEIKQPAKSITIENVGGKWTITAPVLYPADAAVVAQLLSGFSKFKIGSLISSNPEKQQLFQVDTSGTRLSLTDRSGKLVSLIIGKMGPSFSEVYFRLPESKDVYLGEGINSWTINKDLKDWRDRSIIRIPSEMIRELSFTKAAKTHIVTHDSAGWKFGNRVIETNEINSLLNALKDLRTEDFIDSVIDITTKPINVAIKGADDVILNLYPKSPDSAKYYVRSSKSSQMFSISKSTAQQIIDPLSKIVGISKPAAEIVEKPKEDVPPPPPIVSEPKEDAPKPEVKPIKEPAKVTTKPPITKEKPTAPPIDKEEPPKTPPTPKKVEKVQESNLEDEGDLIVHTVKSGETMTTIAKHYKVLPEQIIKWNLLKSISVRPGQELYIYVKQK
ncbi:MAG: DUF4340 domain-containing protein [Bacteroidota bacterium]|nr:DUF4340 domain-containing protein [Bacteroidota bacterium]